MNLLAFDTATEATVVSVQTEDGVYKELFHLPEEGERPGHTNEILKLADKALTELGLGWSDLNRIGVGLGPGSFTGLRVALATAHGIAASLKLSLVGVPTLAVLLRQASVRNVVGPVVAVIDAKRQEYFVASNSVESSAAMPLALTAEQLEEYIVDLSEHPVTLIGDGASKAQRELPNLSFNVDEDDRYHRIDGKVLLQLTAEQSLEPGLIKPIYVREPDAKPYRSGLK